MGQRFVAMWGRKLMGVGYTETAAYDDAERSLALAGLNHESEDVDLDLEDYDPARHGYVLERIRAAEIAYDAAEAAFRDAERPARAAFDRGDERSWRAAQPRLTRLSRARALALVALDEARATSSPHAEIVERLRNAVNPESEGG
jgi:hypothetical protein